MNAATATRTPRQKALPGACDTHMHFYDKKYPTAPTATLTPPDATPEIYRALQQRVGLSRTVVVQPTTYGLDNRCTLEGMAKLGKDVARGIAVVDDKVSDIELRRLTDAGMRGARFQMLPGGAIWWEVVDAVAARVQSVGWHVQLQMDGRLFPDREAQILRWPGRVVIDHIGRFMGPVGVDHPSFRCLLRLVDTGRVWVKLSAPYENASPGAAPPFPEASAPARALVKAAPERMMWATNWPHPGHKGPPDEADLIDTLLDWAPDDATRKKILVDNPAEVYGF